MGGFYFAGDFWIDGLMPGGFGMEPVAGDAGIIDDRKGLFLEDGSFDDCGVFDWTCPTDVAPRYGG